MEMNDAQNEFPRVNMEGRGFWLLSELSGLKADNRRIFDALSGINQTLSELKVQVASKVDKDDFHTRLEEFRRVEASKQKETSALVEVLKVLASGAAAAISALTGMKLLN